MENRNFRADIDIQTVKACNLMRHALEAFLDNSDLSLFWTQHWQDLRYVIFTPILHDLFQRMTFPLWIRFDMIQRWSLDWTVHFTTCTVHWKERMKIMSETRGSPHGWIFRYVGNKPTDKHTHTLSQQSYSMQSNTGTEEILQEHTCCTRCATLLLKIEKISTSGREL